MIGKVGQFERVANARNLEFYSGLRGYKTFEKILGPTLASRLGWANNYHYVRSVMRFGGTVYNLGGPATGSYGKELALIAKYGYKLFINLF